MAIKFDGTDNAGYQSTTEVSYGATNFHDHSVCFFFKPGTADFATLWQYAEQNNTEFGPVIFRDSTGSLFSATANQASIDIQFSAGSLVTGQWYFIAYSLVNTVSNLYYKPVGASTCFHMSTASSFGAGSPHNTIDIGYDFGGDPSDGTHCAYKFWAGVGLRPEEFDLESEQLAPVRTLDLYAYWRMRNDSDLVDSYHNIVLAPQGLSTSQTFAPDPPLPEYRKARAKSKLFKPPSGIKVVLPTDAIFYGMT